MDKCVQMWTRNYGALGQTARGCFGVLCANRTREVKRDFGDLPMRRNEGRVVNTSLVFKRVLFQGERWKKGVREKNESPFRGVRVRGENGRKEKGEKTEETRGEDRRDGERKGLSPELE
ncbi:hypothetical protein TNCV_1402411 [Trichonephila clavipes]|nr:hypothetical protein TNCV_1402411 [Trichonephila clavipes]